MSTEDRDEILGVVVNELHPALIRWGVKSIDGYTIDGQPATPELLISNAPEALTAEIGQAIQYLSSLDPKDVLTFKWPTTFGAQVDGQTPDSVAPSANATSITGPENADGSSRS